MHTVLEFYSGIGGMHYSLKYGNTTPLLVQETQRFLTILFARRANISANVVQAFDINTNGNKVYAHNFKLKPNQV